MQQKKVEHLAAPYILFPTRRDELRGHTISPEEPHGGLKFLIITNS